ncbi:MAG: hypothetical protein GXY37_06410 [Chloroflexi bacterium]|nr:hypothetical protein [Chloroflexota bacterium]
MNNKITIIEGPTPVFEPIYPSSGLDQSRAWTAGILEGPFLYDMAFTTLRTFNGQLLLNRCQNAWEAKQTMFLVYKDRVGLTKQTPIVAARAMTTEEGEVLLLWVRRELHSDDPADSEDGINF